MRVAQKPPELSIEEQRLVRRVVDEIRNRRPEVEVDLVERQTLAALEEFRGCRVREFLPILVQRAVLRRLTA